MCRCNYQFINLEHNWSFCETKRFNCFDYNQEHKHFAAICKNCPYNANGFAKNYFSSKICYSFAEHKDYHCGFCAFFKKALNDNVYKLCIGK